MQLIFNFALQNFQQQPSKQLLDMLKWLFQEVGALHAVGKAHGSVSLASITCHPEHGWKLAEPKGDLKAADKGTEDAVAVARVLCYMCLSSEHRSSNQPHHLPHLSEAELLDLIANVPDVRIAADALFSGRAAVSDALHFHLWHPLAVHAQVRILYKSYATELSSIIMVHVAFVLPIVLLRS
jgi:hypothetical protein